MSSWIHKNPNPYDRSVGDCTVRAIALATDREWDDVYLDLCIEGYILKNMPDGNDVWQSFLAHNGWVYHRLQDSCPFCYTVADFCKEYTAGTFIVGTGTHVVCIKNGQVLDSYDSSDKTALFYFERL